jgi:hypothetical protein
MQLVLWENEFYCERALVYGNFINKNKVNLQTTPLASGLHHKLNWQ